MRCLGLHSKEPLFGRLHVGTWMILPGNVMYRRKGSIWGYETRVTAHSGGTHDEACLNPLAGRTRSPTYGPTRDKFR